MRISVVTPSLNQGRYLEECLQSVLGQGYPDLEYLVMDGGSTDESVEVIERHDRELAFWVSEPDGGQAAAINRGFEKATGDILCWLNSDDMHLPGTIAWVAGHLRRGEPDLVFGDCVHIDERTGRVHGTDVAARHAMSDLRLHDYLVQPATFWTRDAWERVGPLDETLHFAFDWDWFIRAEAAGVKFTPLLRPLAVYRIHAQHKTASGAEARRAEIADVLGRYAGPRFERMFARMCEHPDQLRRIRTWTRRLHVKDMDALLLKLEFPAVCLGHDAQAIRDVAEMV